MEIILVTCIVVILALLIYIDVISMINGDE
jgi:hypothetical protein